MLSFLPIIGPFIQGLIAPVFQGVSGIFGKYWDSKVSIKKVEASELKTETEGSVQIIHETKDDWGVRLARDVVLWPWAAWMGMYGWDTLIAKSAYRDWMFHVADVPSDVAYIPYAVMVFLLGNIGLNMWKNKL